MEDQAKAKEWCNLFLLTLCWGLTVTSSCLLTSIGPLCAKDLGASNSVATFTIGAFLLGCALISLPAVKIFEKAGRAGGFGLGCVLCLLAAAVGLAAVQESSVPTLYAACFLAGCSQGIGQFYRFAAMEVCAQDQKALAVTMVLSGGVLAAFAGPQLAIHTQTLLLHKYAGPFVMVGGLGVVNLLLLLGVRWPNKTDDDKLTDKFVGVEAAEEVLVDDVSLWQLMTRKECILATATATSAQTAMVTLMSPLTLAMDDRGFSFSIATTALELHFFSMYAPGFFTGRLMAHIGATRTALVGGGFYAAATGILLAGHEEWNFVGGMMCCGVGWNMCFSAATVMLEECYNERQANKVQGSNDFVLFLLAGIGSFCSGFIYDYASWRVLVLIVAAMKLCFFGLVLASGPSIESSPSEASAADEEDVLTRSRASSVASFMRASMASDAVFVVPTPVEPPSPVCVDQETERETSSPRNSNDNAYSALP